MESSQILWKFPHVATKDLSTRKLEDETFEMLDY